jgi:Ca2+-binding EF-hand superfamily protein
MERLDLNRDGEVSADELYEIIKSVDSTFTSGQLSNSVDWVIKRLTDEARSFPSMKDYARGLIRKMDRDNDGIISF